MKIRDFIKLNADIDVYNDVTDAEGICFCGPMMLTEEGKEHFSEVMDYDIDTDFTDGYWTASVKCDGEDWRRKIRKAHEFFCAAAGYCADEDYQKWFCDIDFCQYAIDPTAMMDVTIYCDTAWYDKDKCWYTEDEINSENLCEMSFPRKMVQAYYIANGGTINSFVEWIQDEYTADDTNNLFCFCMNNGFIAVREV